MAIIADNHRGDELWTCSSRRNVGAVILTHDDPGWLLRNHIRRKLLEVLCDGCHEADAQLDASAKSLYSILAADRKLLTIPADANQTAKLAQRYANPSLGEIAVSRTGTSTIFDFGEWKSEVATRKNPDGTVSFITTAPGLIGAEFTVGSGPKRTLTIRDAQHEYVFQER